MKNTEDIKARFQELFDQRADLTIKEDLARKIEDAFTHQLCIDKIYKTTIQIRELAWVLDGDVT